MNKIRHYVYTSNKEESNLNYLKNELKISSNSELYKFALSKLYESYQAGTIDSIIKIQTSLNYLRENDSLIFETVKILLKISLKHSSIDSIEEIQNDDKIKKLVQATLREIDNVRKKRA